MAILFDEKKDHLHRIVVFASIAASILISIISIVRFVERREEASYISRRLSSSAGGVLVGFKNTDVHAIILSARDKGLLHVADNPTLFKNRAMDLFTEVAARNGVKVDELNFNFQSKDTSIGKVEIQIKARGVGIVIEKFLRELEFGKHFISVENFVLNTNDADRGRSDVAPEFQALITVGMYFAGGTVGKVP